MVNESPVMSFVFSFLALVIFSTFIIQRLVQERESRNKQLQEVMGLHLWLDHLVWLLSSVLLLLIIVVLAALVLSLGGLQPRADLGVLIAFLLCYGLSVVSFCYLVASLVPTTVLAVFTGVMGLLVFNIPFVSISVIQASVPLTVLLLTCLFPSSAFGFGFRIICQYELLEEGASHANMWTPPTKGSEMTLGLAIVMLLVDAALFLLISLAASHLRQGRHLTPSCKPNPPRNLILG
ncbi:ATP-binding cassette sub-family A member 13 [Chionoecetes opilio]|uniref:ATP-binding cassette sub-family A member 13 n=1 Tax=Chionoecetes opilio TaxID=41210 RepID=A0A8J4XU66_CHIOP|nr:ATP-binding cassette sub-family A member 13 [Chionoecetes opilio]